MSIWEARGSNSCGYPSVVCQSSVFVDVIVGGKIGDSVVEVGLDEITSR